MTLEVPKASKPGPDSGLASDPGVSRMSALGATILISAYFVPSGLSTVYLPVWLEQARGLSPAEIGTVVGLATLARTVAGPLVAAWAETVGQRRALSAMAGACLAACLGLFFVDRMAGVLLLVVVFTAAMSGLGPLTEALLMSATARARRLSFGVARGVGSMAFSLGTIIGGGLVAVFGGAAVMGGLALASLALLLATRLVDPVRPQPGRRAQAFINLREGIVAFRSAALWPIALAVCLVQAAHAQYYSFSTNIWLRQGIDATLIGPLWTVGVIAEVFLLVVAARMFRGWRPEWLVMLGALGGMVRWTVLGFAPELEWLWGLQGLHAFSFAATHLGMLMAVRANVPEHRVGLALAIYSSLAFGPVLALATWAGGSLTEAYSALGPAGEARGYWLMAGCCVAGGIVATLAQLRGRGSLPQPPQKAGSGGAT
jgi:PPP family 3-phenylpropionic acid transporter